MKRILTILIALTIVIGGGAQTKGKKQTAKAKTATTQKAQTKKKATTKPQTKKTTKKVATKKGTTQGKAKSQTPTTAEIRGLQNQRNQVNRKLQQQRQKLAKNKAEVKQKLANLMVINSEIDARKKAIDTIQSDIVHIDGNIGILQSQLATLETQLGERRANFIKSMRYMARHRGIQDKLMFIFSARNLTQMYRRLRFVRQYAAFQRAQGELLKAKQDQVTGKKTQLQNVKGRKTVMLAKGQKEHAKLQGQQEEQKKVVASLQGQQKVIQGLIAEQQKKSAELNAQIDRLVAIEVEKARVRAAEEAKRKAAEAAAAKKARAEALARKKAEAERREQENRRRIEEARRQEQAARDAAREAAAKNDREAKERADQRAREAEAQREAAERKAAADKRRQDKELAEAKEKANESTALSSADQRMSGNFAANKGRLPMPMSGKIVSHYGQYSVEGLSGVKLSNNGINIRSSAGSPVWSIFEGEVSAVFGFSGTMVVMVRHGAYISVYCNLGAVSVSKGQHVGQRQTLGSIGSTGILQFQLRKETAKLNPEAWLR